MAQVTISSFFSPAGALRLALALLLATPAAAQDAIGRMVDAAGLAGMGEMPDDATLRRLCADDALCAARAIADRLGRRARLERVGHPDTDIIRWVTTAASVVVHDATRIEINRFERKVMPELRAALATAGAGPDTTEVVVDLRRNRGGDFERMLAVAGLLLGPVPRALALRDAEGLRWRALDGEQKPGWRLRRVLISPQSASSAEILAALLVAHGGARLCGSGPTAGKDVLQSVVQVDHGWRLLIERARVEVPGVDLAKGLRPHDTCTQ